MRRRDFTALVEAKEEEYDEARDEEFRTALADFISQYTVDIVGGKVMLEKIHEGDLQNFLDEFDLEFPESFDWAVNEVENQLIDMQEAKYDMEKGN
jgi:hypothetical protein